jgi:formamidopyrimidine-DNA glycosylase
VSGGKCEHFYFHDERNIANFDVFFDTANFLAFITGEGPDLLDYAVLLQTGSRLGLELTPDDDITAERWRGVLKRKNLAKKRICEFLMDQKYFSGIGNYLRAEILYDAKISPYRTLGSLNDSEIETLRQKSLDIIYRSYNCKGLTIYTYKDPDGHTGTFVCQVYGRDLDPNGHKVLTFSDKNNRTVHWVKEVQL